jgi:tetratricopeptide (TPR) repeat protein
MGTKMTTGIKAQMLKPDVQQEMDELCRAGDERLDAGEFDEALKVYRAAAELIPDPKEDWEASTWIFTAIGEALFFKGKYAEAARNLRVAVASPDGLGNPLVHLRLGEVYYELNDFEKAGDELTRAYMGGGKEIFESEDPKYIDFLATKIDLV